MTPEQWRLKHGDLVARWGCGRPVIERYPALFEIHLLTKQGLRDGVALVRREGGPTQAWTPCFGSALQERRKALDALSGGQEPPEQPAAHVSDPSKVGDWLDAVEAPKKMDLVQVDREAELYTTVLRKSGTQVSTTFAQHAEILRAYAPTNMGGRNLTQYQVARALGWTKTMVRDYLQAHEADKSTVPVPHALVQEARTDEDIEDLARLWVSDTSVSYRKLADAIDRNLRRDTERDARKWAQRREETAAVVRSMLQGAPIPDEPRPLRVSKAAEPYELVVCASDVHWGMRSWSLESGYDYNRDVARARIDGAVEDALAWIDRHGAPARIVYPYGSDRYHVDLSSLKGATTYRGTEQHVDGTPLEIFQTGLDHDLQTISRLAEIAPVLLVPCRGNHDSVSGIAAHQRFLGLAEHWERLEVVHTYRTDVVVQVASALVLFKHGHHGRGGPTSKTRRTSDATVLQQHARQVGYCREELYVVTGHVHHDRYEEGSVTHVTCPSLAAPDAWHADQGYVGTKPAMVGLVFVEGQGLKYQCRWRGDNTGPDLFERKRR